MAVGILATAFALLCWKNKGFAFFEKLDGNYVLVSPDRLDELKLSYLLEDGNCVGRVKGPVVLVGWNSACVVAARRSAGSSLEYYIVNRQLDGPYAETSKVVTGPFSQVQYLAQQRAQGLPELHATIAK